MLKVPIQSTVFEFFPNKKCDISDRTIDKNLIIYACLHNHPEKFSQLLPTTVWTPFELMITVMSSNSRNQDLTIWNIILTLLTPEDAVKTILDTNGQEHTLLSYLCCNAWRHKPNKYEPITIYQKFESLLDLGCKWNTPLHNDFTPLRWLLWSNECLDLLKWCIEHGANPHEGHLLNHAFNYITREKQLEKAEAQRWYEENPRSVEPVIIKTCKPLKNNFIIDYLISLGLDVNDTLEEDGRTPLLSACSEGNVHKVRLLLEAGASIYSKLKDGTDVWFWAEQHYTIPYPTIKDYPMRELLQRYETHQKRY